MGYSMRSLVHFGQLYDVIKKPIFKITHLKQSQISVWKPDLFHEAIKKFKKFFLSRSLPTLEILPTKFVSIWSILWTNQTELFFKKHLFEMIVNFRTKN